MKERLKNVLNFKKRSGFIVIAAVLLVSVLTVGFAVNRITNEPSGEMNLAIVNNSSAEIFSIGLFYDNQSGGVQNADNSLFKKGETIHFQIGERQHLDFKVQISDKDWNVLAEGFFTKDFTHNKNERVYLYVIDDEHSGVYIVNSNENIENNQLTLDDVRVLAAKGDALQYSDFPNLRPSMLSSYMGGYNPTLYGVEGGYRLLVTFNDTLNPENGINSISLERIWDNGGSGIDIRYNDVDEFIRTHPSYPADATHNQQLASESLQEKIKPYEHLGVSINTTNGLMMYEERPVREIWDSTKGTLITESIGPNGFAGRDISGAIDLTVVYENGRPVSFRVSTQEEYDMRTEERRDSVRTTDFEIYNEFGLTYSPNGEN